jgi:hypothetical protein
MCVAIRYGSPASIRMFHGARHGMTNIPGLSLTEKHFDIYRARDNDPLFIEYLFEEEYVTTPRQY